MLHRNSTHSKPCLGSHREKILRVYFSGKLCHFTWKESQRQSHKLLNIGHLNFSTFGVLIHINPCESAILGKKEERQHKNLQNNSCYLFPRARLPDMHKGSQEEPELRCCRSGHGSHSKNYRSDCWLGTTLSRVWWEECTVWQLLPSVAILRNHYSIVVLGNSPVTAMLSEQVHLQKKLDKSFVGSINVFLMWKKYL